MRNETAFAEGRKMTGSRRVIGTRKGCAPPAKMEATDHTKAQSVLKQKRVPAEHNDGYKKLVVAQENPDRLDNEKKYMKEITQTMDACQETIKKIQRVMRECTLGI